MPSLQIRDLDSSSHLDKKTLATTYGGIFDWIAAYRPGRPSNPYGTTVGQIHIFNVLLVNPVFNTVNQNQLINIDVTEVVGSSINVLVDQGQAGSNRSLPFPV